MKVILTMIIISIACISCRNPDSTPELRDPIYLDLQKGLGIAEKDLKMVSDERPKIQDQLKTLNEQTGEYKARWKDYYSNEKKIYIAEQRLNYFKMAVDSRRKQARLEYLDHFKQEKEDEWPNPDDFAIYKSRMNGNEYLKGGQ